MTEITIFSDESGTMPRDDDHGLFCAAMLGTVDEPPVLSTRSGHKSDVLQACATFGCVPQIVFVRPKPGYGKQLRAKTSKMNTMARASRLATGSHEYLPVQGHNDRNLIWIRCMAVCLVRLICRTANLETLERVRVVLDRKTLAKPSRKLFTDRVCSLAEDILAQNSHRFDVTVLWSDDPEAAVFEDGLFLAHHLSGMARAALEAGTENELAEQLSEPRADLFYDITPDVVAPLPRWSVEKWKIRTGLPEPLE